MKKITLFMICIAYTSAWAQTVDRPQLGKMLDSNGAVRTVYGIAASVTLGDTELTNVVSAACSATLCLAKTDAALLWASSTIAAPGGPALFAFDGNNAYVWFSAARQLLICKPAAGCQGVDLIIDGEVLSIGANAGALQFAVRRRSGVWIVNQDGSVASALPRAAGPVMLIPGGVVYAERDQIVIGNTCFPLAGVIAFSQMAGNYLQVFANGASYALRIDPGRETLFQMPGAPQ